MYPYTIYYLFCLYLNFIKRYVDCCNLLSTFHIMEICVDVVHFNTYNIPLDGCNTFNQQILTD